MSLRSKTNFSTIGSTENAVRPLRFPALLIPFQNSYYIPWAHPVDAFKDQKFRIRNKYKFIEILSRLHLVKFFKRLFYFFYAPSRLKVPSVLNATPLCRILKLGNCTALFYWIAPAASLWSTEWNASPLADTKIHSIFTEAFINAFTDALSALPPWRTARTPQAWRLGSKTTYHCPPELPEKAFSSLLSV